MLKFQAFQKEVQRNAALPKLLKIPGKNVPELSTKADKWKVWIVVPEVVFIFVLETKS